MQLEYIHKSTNEQTNDRSTNIFLAWTTFILCVCSAMHYVQCIHSAHIMYNTLWCIALLMLANTSRTHRDYTTFKWSATYEWACACMCVSVPQILVVRAHEGFCQFKYEVPSKWNLVALPLFHTKMINWFFFWFCMAVVIFF